MPKQVKERKDINLYEKVLVSDTNTMNKNKSQIEQWSILSDNIVYVRSAGKDVINRIDIKWLIEIIGECVGEWVKKKEKR